MKKKDPALWQSPWCGKREAEFFARKAADEYCLPQTVFRAPEDEGVNWRHAAAASAIFDRRKDLILFITVIPNNYWS